MSPSITPGTSGVDRARLTGLLAREQSRFAVANAGSAAAYERADSLFGRVPMTWMNKTSAHFPLYLDSARGAHITDVDGHTYVDFSLGDTGSMAGHSPAPVAAAVRRRVEQLGGLAAMLPTEQAQTAGAMLAERFGLPRWSFSLTATDANRWAIRLARAVTGRPKILVNSYCYHGSVDESLIVTSPEGGAPRPGNVGAPVPVAETSRVAEFNDLDALARELAHGDVAAVLMEPALTNIGIVLPEPGYLDGVRELTRRHGSLLIIDETHTFCAGPGGATRAWSLAPDVVTIGKAIGGGIPAGAYGLSAELAELLLSREDLDLVDMGGVGGTLAGNALSIAAVCATLGEVLTDESFEHMRSLGGRRGRDDREAPAALVRHQARRPRRIPLRRSGAAHRNRGGRGTRPGARRLPAHLPRQPRHPHDAVPQHGPDVPATGEADVDLHTRHFAAAIAELVGRDEPLRSGA
jgi:glutamate-1-semialdehyde 2,1-aminomutase